METTHMWITDDFYEYEHFQKEYFAKIIKDMLRQKILEGRHLKNM